MRELEQLGATVNRWAESNGMDVARNLRIFSAERWREIVGDDLADSGMPLRIRNGTLVIQANNRLGATRLRYASDAIRMLCNELAGSEVIDRVRVIES